MKKVINYFDKNYTIILFGTLGLISLNHNQGTIASNIEVGYPYGN